MAIIIPPAYQAMKNHSPSLRRISAITLALTASLVACQQAPSIPTSALDNMPSALPAHHSPQQARQQLAEQKAVLQQQLTQSRKNCYQRFWVNICLNKAQQRFNSQMLDIDRQDLALRKQARQIRENQRRLRLQNQTYTGTTKDE